MKELSASDLTKEALIKLRAKGYDVWRQGNNAVKRRKNMVRKGQSDIIGYSSKGLFTAAEVKTLNDTLSEDQKYFLQSVKNKGGHAYLVTQEGNQAAIKEY